MNELTIRQSGDGYEVLDAQGNAIAWTLGRKWALRILLGLEILDRSTYPKTPEPNQDRNAS